MPSTRQRLRTLKRRRAHRKSNWSAEQAAFARMLQDIGTSEPDIMSQLPQLDPDQIPSFVKTPADLKRWRLCAGITFRVCGRLDPFYVNSLYNSDLDSGL